MQYMSSLQKPRKSVERKNEVETEYENIRNHSPDIYYSFSNMHFYLVYHENKYLSMLVY